MTARSSFDVQRFDALRLERNVRAGSPLHAVAVTASTNDDALAAARRGAGDGTTFVADWQTSGRGRRGRTWHAQPGESLLFSVVVREPLRLDQVGSLSLVTGVALRRALAGHLAKAQGQGAVLVKWPNDIWVGGKKIAGVLAETQLEGGSLRAAVIGVGVNVAATRFPDELSATATSLALCGINVGREQLLVDLLASLEEALRTLSHAGLGHFTSELARYDALAGRRVRIEDASGVACGIDDLGRLLVRRDAGDVTAVTSGTVELDR